MEIYGANYISSYCKMQTRAPHVYAVAKAAYDEMMKGLLPYCYVLFYTIVLIHIDRLL